jgi:hypothetical protein
VAAPAGAPTSNRQASAPGAYEVEIGDDAKRPSSDHTWRGHPLGASPNSHHRGVKRQRTSGFWDTVGPHRLRARTTARLCCAHLGRKVAFNEGFCGARWNRTTDVSIIRETVTRQSIPFQEQSQALTAVSELIG